MMGKDERFGSIDVAQCYTHVKVIEPSYALPPIPSMDFYIDPAMTSTPPTEHIKHTPTKLKLAVMIARRVDEPEPDYLGFDSWLKQEFPVRTSD